MNNLACKGGRTVTEVSNIIFSSPIFRAIPIFDEDHHLDSDTSSIHHLCSVSRPAIPPRFI